MKNNIFLPLAKCDNNKKLILRKIEGGVGIKNRLYSMGLIPGEIIKIINTDKKGPLIIEIKDTKIAIGRGMAMKILVEEV